MFYTGIDPFTKTEIYVARGLRDRKMQRALMQFFKPENSFEVREVLMQAGRQDLIGGGCDALIPAQPPKESIAARRHRANEAARGWYVHTMPHGTPGKTKATGWDAIRRHGASGGSSHEARWHDRACGPPDDPVRGSRA
jgi:hypothetical protein